MLSRLKERSLSSPYLLLTGLSLAIRLLTASLVVVLSSLLTPFDTSAVLASSSYKLAPFLTWDATFFFSIAEHSYTFEQQLAFGPALPALIRTGGHLVAFLACSSDPTPSIAHMVIGGTALAILAGTAATLALYRLTLSIFPTHPSFAFLSSLLFLLPPSPITLNAVPYTEPFFALTSFVGMEAAMRAKPRYLVAAAILGVGTLFRPQGIVIGVGLFGWRLLLVETRARGPFEISRALRNLPRFLFFTAISFLPFALYQYYAYTAFCTNATSPRPWCSNTLPMSYSWIQAHYWNVGFLNYYTPSQIPNFLFAAPPLLLTFFSLKSFYSHNPTLLSPATSSPTTTSVCLMRIHGS
ncbi:Dol-P-Man:alpha-1,6-mannosyltransferase, glycosyltransferase family 76 protein [Pseudohyphozyma bogoriensis]|nr:Dol-P-Man:alpha-1,6-mannosyltransferase, glycosyltransferase family 76 protein [Pseudohyphozyma bogoriensis]